MSERINDVTIVGGGDSGLLAALCLEKLNPGLSPTVIDDFSSDIPQVGKSTYLSIREVLHGTLDIDERRFITEVKPVWKATVYFRDWCGYPEFHFSFDPGTYFSEFNRPNAIEDYYLYYQDFYGSPDHRTIGEEIAATCKSPWTFNPRSGEYDCYNNTAYHLNTQRFNSFLRDLCRERGISLIDDEIVDVEVSDNRVDGLRSKSQSYEADLYVDATGFNRVIKDRLDSEFVDFNFPLDSAFNTRVDRPLSEIEPATVIESGEYGWFWQIDTFDNRDLGYVYASEYVSDDAARQEFLEHCGGDVTQEDVVKYEFSSGYFAPAWETNCVAIGNAEGFVEPLQSTGLTANAEAATQLSRLLSARGRIDDQEVRRSYNAWVHESWQSIYDFISIHYKYADGDNEFWQRMQDLDLSPRTELLIQDFDEHGLDRAMDPTLKDDEMAPLSVFNHLDFYVIMRNMGATSTFYESNDFEVSEEFRTAKEEHFQQFKDHVAEFLTTEEMYEQVVASQTP